jgi:hypothetical protein
VAYVRTVKTSSGATAVQVVWSFRRGSRKIEHIGSAHDDAGLEALKAAARQRLAAGQLELDLGMDGPGPAGPLEIALRARPIYHRKRDSIEAHLTIVFAALAVTRFIEGRTGWSIRKFVRTARRYRTVQIRVGPHILAAQDPLPPDLRDALALIK